MKALVIVSCVLYSFLIFVGFIFRIQHWLGGNLMFTLGFYILFLVFLPALLLMSWKTKQKQKDTAIKNNDVLSGNIVRKASLPKALAIGFGIFSTPIALIGLVFKVMHWPGADVMLMGGAGLFLLVTIPLLTAHKVKRSRQISDVKQ